MTHCAKHEIKDFQEACDILKAPLLAKLPILQLAREIGGEEKQSINQELQNCNELTNQIKSHAKQLTERIKESEEALLLKLEKQMEDLNNIMKQNDTSQAYSQSLSQMLLNYGIKEGRELHFLLMQGSLSDKIEMSLSLVRDKDKEIKHLEFVPQSVDCLGVLNVSSQKLILNRSKTFLDTDSGSDKTLFQNILQKQE
jgi:vacuolar-type H+-ATPase subunit I/STV1